MESVGSIIAYWLIVAAIVVSSVLTVTTRKILRSATYLLFTLFATAALYFKLDYEFLGTVQIAVYAGGIVVLFVFSILLTQRPGENSPVLRSGKKALGLLAALATLLVSGAALLSRCGDLCTQLPAMENLDMKVIGESLLGSGSGQYLLPFEAISVLLLACIIGGVVVARKR